MSSSVPRSGAAIVTAVNAVDSSTFPVSASRFRARAASRAACAAGQVGHGLLEVALRDQLLVMQGDDALVLGSCLLVARFGERGAHRSSAPDRRRSESGRSFSSGAPLRDLGTRNGRGTPRNQDLARDWRDHVGARARGRDHFATHRRVDADAVDDSAATVSIPSRVECLLRRSSPASATLRSSGLRDRRGLFLCGWRGIRATRAHASNVMTATDQRSSGGSASSSGPVSASSVAAAECMARSSSIMMIAASRSRRNASKTGKIPVRPESNNRTAPTRRRWAVGYNTSVASLARWRADVHPLLRLRDLPSRFCPGFGGEGAAFHRVGVRQRDLVLPELPQRERHREPDDRIGRHVTRTAPLPLQEQAGNGQLAPARSAQAAGGGRANPRSRQPPAGHRASSRRSSRVRTPPGAR